MAKIEIEGKTYETTHRGGMPAIRSLNKSGGTHRWIGLRTPVGRAVMTALDVEPAMATGFNRVQSKEAD